MLERVMARSDISNNATITTRIIIELGDLVAKKGVVSS